MRKASGSPEKLRNYAKDFIVAKQVDGLDLRDRSRLHKFFNKLESISVEKINLFPVSFFMGIAALFLAMRYFFYGQEKYQLGYLFAMIAYLIYAFQRMR